MHIKLLQPYNNETAHSQVKQLMKRHFNLDIRLDNEPNAWISSQEITRLRYQLNDKGWQWILNYLKTGDYEDFGIFPSERTIYNTDFQLHTLKSLIESGVNVKHIPFLRETQAYITLIALFNYGKVFFNIKRTDEFTDYLNAHGK